MIIEISIAVIALAFVILVIYLVLTAKDLRVTLIEVNHTLVDVRKQLGEIGFQAQKAMEHANQISFDLKQKADDFSPLFKAVSNAGEILERKTSALKNDFFSSCNEEIDLSTLEEEKKRVSMAQSSLAAAAILELAGIGIRLWQKMKKRR
jgi:uncharacterized protein YoxC